MTSSLKSDTNPKANIHSTWPCWLGFKRQSFMKGKVGGTWCWTANQLTWKDILNTTQTVQRKLLKPS